jgi:hypothetical protein
MDRTCTGSHSKAILKSGNRFEFLGQLLLEVKRSISSGTRYRSELHIFSESETFNTQLSFESST